MSAPIDINSPPADLDLLLQSAMPELEKLAPQQHVRRSVSRPRALAITNTLLTSWASLIERLDEELSPLMAMQRKVELGRLKARVWTFYMADLRSEELTANAVRAQRRELARAVAAHDRFLFKWAQPVFGDDPVHAETLRDISRGTGARDDAEDVLRLVALFRSNWSQAEAEQNVVTKDYVDKAESDATRQLDLLDNGMINPARQLANAAYTLWYCDYQALMQLGRYFTWDAADSVDRFPGVRELQTRSSGSDEPELDDDASAPDEPAAAVDDPQPADDPEAAA